MDKAERLRIIGNGIGKLPPQIVLNGFENVEIEIPPQGKKEGNFMPEFSIRVEEGGMVQICRISVEGRTPGIEENSDDREKLLAVEITIEELFELLLKR